MKKAKKDYILIKKFFKDDIKRKDVGALSEIECVEHKMREQWGEYSERIDPKIGDRIWAKILKEYRMRTNDSSVFRFRWSLVAACISFAMLLGGYVLYLATDNHRFIKIEAKTETMYILPDSSEVWMHPGSSIRFADNFMENRTVWLEGSSFFNVRKSDGSKFCVHINKAYIEVKGTQFLVDKLEDGKNEITLFKGCVSFVVETTKKQIEMTPLDQVVYDSDKTEIKKRKIENIELHNEKFTFNAMPLNQLLRIINQLYHTNIVFEGNGSGSLFSGTIRADEPLEDVIDKICFLMNLTFRKVGNKIIICK